MTLATRLLGCTAVALGLAACAANPPPTPAEAGPGSQQNAVRAAPPPAPSVADLQGAPAPSGQAELNRRGYVLANTQGPTGYWWHSDAQSCARTVTSQGRFQTVQLVAPAGCGH